MRTQQAIGSAATRTLVSARNEARLFQIEVELPKVKAQIEKSGRIHDEAERQVFAWKEHNPRPALRVEWLPIENQLQKLLDRRGGSLTVAGVAKAISRTAPVPKHQVEAHAKAMARWEKQLQAAKRRFSYGRKEVALCAAVDRAWALREEAASIRATTIDGLKCKARMVNSAEDTEFDGVADSIARDLIAFSAQ